MPHQPPQHIPYHHSVHSVEHSVEHEATDAVSMLAAYYPLVSSVLVSVGLIVITLYFSWTKLVSSVRTAILNPQDKPGKKALMEGVLLARQMITDKNGKAALSSSTLPGSEAASQ